MPLAEILKSIAEFHYKEPKFTVHYYLNFGSWQRRQLKQAVFNQSSESRREKKDTQKVFQHHLHPQSGGESYCCHEIGRKAPSFSLHPAISKLSMSCHKRCMGSVLKSLNPALCTSWPYRTHFAKHSEVRSQKLTSQAGFLAAPTSAQIRGTDYKLLKQYILLLVKDSYKHLLDRISQQVEQQVAITNAF